MIPLFVGLIFLFLSCLGFVIYNNSWLDLVICRALQALGSSLILPCGFTIVFNLYHEDIRKEQIATSWIMSCMALGS
eukprot:UN23836